MNELKITKALKITCNPYAWEIQAKEGNNWVMLYNCRTLDSVIRLASDHLTKTSKGKEDLLKLWHDKTKLVCKVLQDNMKLVKEMGLQVQGLGGNPNQLT